DKYRFQGEYLGLQRKTSSDVHQSMMNVFSLFVGKPTEFKEMIKTSLLFKVGTEEIWMPIQSVILSAFHDEVKKGEVVTLYCLFLNEHNNNNKLFNTFLISEFQK
ncbi:MAG TPA: hypothetical protein VFV37_00395, partial [Luteibaculaceae bacterium]|nr:hypothetical protein [Luteibaculaceae bacterium]